MLFTRLRSWLFLLFLAFSVIPWATLALLLSVFVRGERLYRWCTAWLRLSVGAARWICGVRYRVHGTEHLHQAQHIGQVVLLPKHQSTWETFAFPVIMPRPLSFVFKRELLQIPFFGWAMARLDMIHIDRSKRNEAWSRIEEQGKAFMALGHWVIMFPEGTRVPRGESGHYKTGGTRLAVSTGASVLPVAVTSARCWPRKSLTLHPGIIEVSIGPPLSSQGRQAAELMQEVEAWIEAEMRRLDPGAYVLHEPPSTQCGRRFCKKL